MFGTKRPMIPMGVLANQVVPDKVEYDIKQKDAQTIYISSTESRTNISIPQLVPNFLALQEMFGGGANDIYYQLQSFRFKNKFLNIPPRASVDVYSTIRWHNTTTGETIQIGGADTEASFIVTLYINPSSDKWMAMNENEIVETLNQQIDALAWQIRVQTAGTDQLSHNFLHCFSNMLFGYDPDTSKITLGFYSGEANFTPIIPLTSGPITSDNIAQWIMDSLFVQFQTSLHTSLAQQTEVSRLLGINEPQNEFAGTTIPDTVSSETSGFPFFYYNADLTLQEIAKLQLKRIGTTYKDFMRYRAPTVIYYFSEQMNPAIFSAIRIHSSLMSNVWNSEGSKTDIIDTVYLTGKQQTEQQLEYEPVSGSTRVCNVRDSISSLQSFFIYLTDENDAEIFFSEPYELKITVFFKPA